MIDFKGSHFEREIVLWGVRWYMAYPISYRQLEEMLEEWGVEVDQSTLNRWVLKYVPLLEQAFRVRKRRVAGAWRPANEAHRQRLPSIRVGPTPQRSRATTRRTTQRLRSGRSSTSTMLSNRTIERSSVKCDR